MRSRAAAAAVAAVLCLAGCGKGGPKAEARRATRTPKVGALPATTRDLQYSVEALGTLEANQVVVVPARLAGVVESLGFEEGASVTPETVLAVVDGVRRDLLLAQAGRAVEGAIATHDRATAAASRAEAQEEAARAGLREAEGKLARREEARVRAPGVVPNEELESARAEVSRWKAQGNEAAAAVGEARAGGREAASAVEEARGRLAIARRDATDARVRPPIAGVAQARHVVVGQWVSAGAPVATLVDASRLRLRFRVPEEASATLVPGRVRISFRTSAVPRDVPATLLYVQSSADPVTRMVECLAEVPDPDPALKPGFFASVTVEVARAASAVIVPEEAVLATERGLVVYAVEAGKARETRVRLGLRTKDGWVEVVEGLTAGTPVVVENGSVVSDGAAVETFPSARAAARAPAPAAAPGPASPDSTSSRPSADAPPPPPAPAGAPR